MEDKQKNEWDAHIEAELQRLAAERGGNQTAGKRQVPYLTHLPSGVVFVRDDFVVTRYADEDKLLRFHFDDGPGYVRVRDLIEQYEELIREEQQVIEARQMMVAQHRQWLAIAEKHRDTNFPVDRN